MATLKTIHTRTGTYTLSDDDIVCQTITTTDLQTLADAQENVRVFRELCGSRRLRMLVDMRVTGPTGEGVRELYRDLSNETSSVALVINSFVGRIIGNFYMAMKRPPIPTRLFADLEEAVAWSRRQPISTGAVSSASHMNAV